jgi:hypothetical protein
MRRIALAPLAALAMIAIGFSPVGGRTAAAATPALAAKKKNDPCGDTKSKWQHFECEEYHGSAPGDEYFGRMKLSYLGIDNTFKDAAVSAGAYTTNPAIISRLSFADDALTQWAKKYPNDPQLARSYFFGEEVYRKVYTQAGQQKAWQYIQILLHKFGDTYFGKIMKQSIAKYGFTEHWFALPQICPTPLPKGVTPENTPSATATPSPAPGQPSIDLITPPCVTPSPTPTASPSPSGSGAPSPSASVSPSPSPTPKRA